MSAFIRKAEEILEIATSGSAALGESGSAALGASGSPTMGDSLMVIDRQGGFRMLKPEGWSLQAAAAEFGAVAVYKVERRGSSVRVEGWNGSERCLLQGQSSGDRARNLLGLPFMPQATMLNLASPALA